MTSSIDNCSPITLVQINPETESKKPNLIMTPELISRMDAFVQETQSFMRDLVDLPNFLQEIPKEKQVTIEKLTKKACELLAIHPLLNLESLKKQHQEISKNLKIMSDEMDAHKLKYITPFLEHMGAEIECMQADSEVMRDWPELKNLNAECMLLSDFMMDCGGLIRMQERHIKCMQAVTQETNKIIQFQENPDQPLSETIKYPFIEVALAIGKLVELKFLNY